MILVAWFFGGWNLVLALQGSLANVVGAVLCILGAVMMESAR